MLRTLPLISQTQFHSQRCFFAANIFSINSTISRAPYPDYSLHISPASITCRLDSFPFFFLCLLCPSTLLPSVSGVNSNLCYLTVKIIKKNIILRTVSHLYSYLHLHLGKLSKSSVWKCISACANIYFGKGKKI